MLILNLKTYPESNSENLFNLLNKIKQFETNKNLYIAPEVIDLVNTKKTFPQFNIISQHVDSVNAGSTTGWIPAENLLANNISFSIFNHSEHRIMDGSIVEKIIALQAKGLKLIVCCENEVEAETILQAKPYAIAYEPKDLIGSGISVTTRPEAVKKFIEVVKGKTIPIIGAGVTTGEDVATSLSLGAEGVLLASAFVKAQDPAEKLQELLGSFKS